MTRERVRALREDMPAAEQRMWYFLRNRRLGGYKFVREQAIGHYIVDFVCRQKKLIIEVDGGQHMAAVSYDQRRTTYLEALGYRVLRIWNNEVFNNIQGVMEKILELLGEEQG